MMREEGRRKRRTTGITAVVRVHPKVVWIKSRKEKGRAGVCSENDGKTNPGKKVAPHNGRIAQQHPCRTPHPPTATLTT